MDEERKSIKTGLGALAALGVGYLLYRVVPFAIAFFFARSAVGLFNTPAEMRDMRAGFEEVTDDWEGWLDAWSDSTEMTFRAWGARVVAQHTTKAELIEIYRLRSDLFKEVASDPSINAVCGVDPLQDQTINTAHPSLDLGPIARVQGRGFARRHVGETPWMPPVDLRIDEQVWIDFVDYLDAKGLGHVADALLDVAEGLPVGNEQLCRAQADMYGAAVQRPEDLVGRVRLIDFVRAMDLLGTGG
ncbi:MAG: hypothetical protein WD960_13795 [Gemmatimonadota bacterium]